MQAAALDSDNLDPLGLGRIDTRLLALVWDRNQSLRYREQEDLVCLLGVWEVTGGNF